MPHEASNGPTGELFDLGYQHYDGPREGRSRARKAIFWNGARTMLGLGRGPKAKILPGLLFVSAMLPALVFVMILSFMSDFTEDANEFIPGPSDYYQVISIVMLIFAAIMAPELLIPDRRERVIDLYLVRPLTSTDYVFGRFLAFFLIVLTLAYSGQLVLFAGLILTAPGPWDYVKDNWLDLPRLLGAGIATALFITVVPLAVAAFTTRRAVASVFVIGLFFISSIVAEGLTTAECHVEQRDSDGPREFSCEPVTGKAAKWFALMSVGDVTIRINDIIFDEEQDDGGSLQAAEELHESIPIAIYGLFTIIPGLFLWRKYRSLQI